MFNIRLVQYPSVCLAPPAPPYSCAGGMIPSKPQGSKPSYPGRAPVWTYTEGTPGSHGPNHGLLDERLTHREIGVGQDYLLADHLLGVDQQRCLEIACALLGRRPEDYGDKGQPIVSIRYT